MKNRWAASQNLPFKVLLSALLLIIIGCAPKIYRSSYSDPEFDFDKIETVIIVLENNERINNPLFAEIFIQTALEKQRFTLIREEYITEKEMSKPDLRSEADAFLKISLTHCYSGFRTRFSSTSVGACAKLIETETNKTVWNTSYAYSSATGGSSAPIVEEVMKIVSNNLIDSVPMGTIPPFFAVLEEPLEEYLEEQSDEQKDILAEAEAEALEVEKLEDILATPAQEIAPEVEKDYSEEAALQEEVVSQDEEKALEIEPEAPAEPEPVLVEIPFKNGPYLVHAASVRVKRKSAADEFINRKTNDGTMRLALLVGLQSKGRWYRLLIGRFKTLDACQSYIRKLKKGGEIDKDVHPVKLPFSLLIGSGQELANLQETINALREKGFPAYLSPPAGKAKAYDVMVGAYGSEKEAAKITETLLENGYSAKVVSF